MSVLLQLDHLSKAHGPHVLFDDISLTISEDQKIGFIGRNGAGKSSLLRVITKHEAADRGGIIEHPGLRLGYLEQQEKYSPEETVLEYLERKSQAPSWTCAKMGSEFELTKAYLNMPMVALSGGYQMRAKLAALFLREPNLVLLDEPTNYLDLQTQLLLEEVLRNFRGSCLIVSHDREFLKNTCTHTLEIERGRVTFFPRDIEEYLAYKEDVERSQVKQNESVEMQKKHLETFISRFRAKASKATQAQSKMKMLERLQTIEIWRLGIQGKLLPMKLDLKSNKEKRWRCLGRMGKERRPCYELWRAISPLWVGRLPFIASCGSRIITNWCIRVLMAV